MAMMVWRVTPTRSASSACVISPVSNRRRRIWLVTRVGLPIGLDASAVGDELHCRADDRRERRTRGTSRSRSRSSRPRPAPGRTARPCRCPGPCRPTYSPKRPMSRSRTSGSWHVTWLRDMPDDLRPRCDRRWRARCRRRSPTASSGRSRRPPAAPARLGPGGRRHSAT